MEHAVIKLKKKVVEVVLQRARQEVNRAHRELHHGISENCTLDIHVSYYGAWQNRGDTVYSETSIHRFHRGPKKEKMDAGKQ
jgi:hypothetical protein